MAYSKQPDDIISKIDEEYREFSGSLDSLEEKQSSLISEYRKKLEDKKLAQIRKDLNKI